MMLSKQPVLVCGLLILLQLSTVSAATGPGHDQKEPEPANTGTTGATRLAAEELTASNSANVHVSVLRRICGFGSSPRDTTYDLSLHLSLEMTVGDLKTGIKEKLKLSKYDNDGFHLSRFEKSLSPGSTTKPLDEFMGDDKKPLRDYVSSLNCRGRCGLQVQSDYATVTCDTCGTAGISGTSIHGCRKCNWDVCDTCYKGTHSVELRLTLVWDSLRRAIRKGPKNAGLVEIPLPAYKPVKVTCSNGISFKEWVQPAAYKDGDTWTVPKDGIYPENATLRPAHFCDGCGGKYFPDIGASMYSCGESCNHKRYELCEPCYQHELEAQRPKRKKEDSWRWA